MSGTVTNSASNPKPQIRTNNQVLPTNTSLIPKCPLDPSQSSSIKTTILDICHALNCQKLHRLKANVTTDSPKMTSGFQTIDWHLISPVRSFSACPSPATDNQVLSVDFQWCQTDYCLIRLLLLNPVDGDACKSIPCAHNGVCKDGIGSYDCYCQAGYQGYNCEIGTEPQRLDIFLCFFTSIESPLTAANWNCH